MLYLPLIDKAIKIALKHSNAPLFKHAAILYDKDGHIISVGFNSINYCIDAIQNPYCSFHAEHMAIFRAYGHRIRKGNSKIYMVVVRCNKKGELRLSKPCYHCQEILKKNRISKIYYSTENSGIEVLELC
jgi:cytidine deaminase